MGETLRLGQAGGITVDAGAGALVIGTTANDGNLTAGGADNTAGELVFINNSTNTSTVNSTIVDNGSGAVTFRKSGSGALTLTSTSNTYSGKTIVDGGTLTILGDGSLGLAPSTADAANISLNNAAVLQWGATFDLNSNRGITIGTGGAKIDTQTFKANIAGLITGSGPLAVSNAVVGATFGSLTLSGANTGYTGTITVGSTALLIVNNNLALGSTSGGTTVSSGGVLQLADGITVTGETLTAAGAAQTNGAAMNRGALQAAGNATATWAGPIAMTADTRVGAQDGGKLTISGVISGTGTALQISASTALALQNTTYVLLSNNANTYTGQTQLIRGTLKQGITNALPIGTTVDVHNAASNTTDYAGWDLAGFDQTIARLQSTGVSSTTTPSNLALIYNSTANLSTLTINQTSGTAEFDGNISGNIALVKSGAGALVFSDTSSTVGHNTYTGTTTLSGGTLQIGKGGLGSSGSGAVSINGSGAILAGTGAVNGATTLVLGTIRPGDTLGADAGTLQFTSGLTLAPTVAGLAGDLNVNAAGTADQIQVSGALSLNANSNVKLSFDSSFTPVLGQSWTLLSWTSALSLNGFSSGATGPARTGADALANKGNLNLPDLSAFNGSYYYTVTQLTDSSGGGSLIVTIAPEPGHTLLMGLALAGLLLRQRRSGEVS